jgi:hypothetical protein
MEILVVKSLPRDKLIAIAENSDAVRLTITELLAGVAPLLGTDITAPQESPDYSTMSEDELIDYLANGSAGVRSFVEQLATTIGPELNKPMTKLALKTVVGMFK